MKHNFWISFNESFHIRVFPSEKWAIAQNFYDPRILNALKKTLWSFVAVSPLTSSLPSNNMGFQRNILCLWLPQIIKMAKYREKKRKKCIFILENGCWVTFYLRMIYLDSGIRCIVREASGNTGSHGSLLVTLPPAGQIWIYGRLFCDLDLDYYLIFLLLLN